MLCAIQKEGMILWLKFAWMGQGSHLAIWLLILFIILSVSYKLMMFKKELNISDLERYVHESLYDLNRLHYAIKPQLQLTRLWESFICTHTTGGRQAQLVIAISIDPHLINCRILWQCLINKLSSPKYCLSKFIICICQMGLVNLKPTSFLRH
jgi:hypothetical protein